jgi:hypothetical protein
MSSAYAKDDGFFAPGLYREQICLPVSSLAWKKRQSKLLNGGRANNQGERQSLINYFFDSGKDAGRMNGSASQVEEVIPYPDGGTLEYLLPDEDKFSFQIGSWRGGFRHNRLSFSGLRLRRAGCHFAWNR